MNTIPAFQLRNRITEGDTREYETAFGPGEMIADAGHLGFLERPEAAPSCPLCAAQLVKALLDDVFAVEHCERCRGILLPRATFAEAVTRRRARESGEPARPVPLDRRELERVVACPSCRSQMDVHPYYGPGNVVIDSCQSCDQIWLDFGELEQITTAGGRDRGWRVSNS